MPAGYWTKWTSSGSDWYAVSGGRCATVSLDNVDFIAPVPVGSEVSIYGELEDVGRSSMQIRIEVWITEHDYKSTETRFVFVAIDSNGRIRQVPGNL